MAPDTPTETQRDVPQDATREQAPKAEETPEREPPRDPSLAIPDIALDRYLTPQQGGLEAR